MLECIIPALHGREMSACLKCCFFSSSLQLLSDSRASTHSYAIKTSPFRYGKSRETNNIWFCFGGNF